METSLNSDLCPQAGVTGCPPLTWNPETTESWPVVMTLVYDDIWHMSALVSQGCHNKALQTRVSKHRKSALTTLEGGSLKSRCRHGPTLAPKALEENPFFLLQLWKPRLPLACGCLALTSASVFTRIFTRPPPPGLFFLIRTPVIVD